MIDKLAQIPLHPPGRNIDGPGLLDGQSATQSPQIFNQVLSTVVGILTLIVIIWFVFKVFIGALALMSAGSDKQKVSDAWKNITFGLIGVVMVISALFIVDFVGNLLGIETPLSPGRYILLLR